MAPRKVLPVIVLVAAASAIGVYWRWFAPKKETSGGIRVSGNIEVTDSEVAFKIPGLVVERLVDEGQSVKKGQVVAQLDTADLEAELAARRAEVQMAEAASAELESGSRPEEKVAAKAAMEKAAAFLEELKTSRPQMIQVAQSTLEAAQIERDRLESELARARSLLDNHTISQETYDQQASAFRVAQAKLREAAEQLSLLKEGARKEQRIQAEEALRQATAQYDLVM
jgi:HlyD family secretion protein